MTKSYQQWSRSPSYHGSYDDYIRHMNSMEDYCREEREKKLIEKIVKRMKEK